MIYHELKFVEWVGPLVFMSERGKCGQMMEALWLAGKMQPFLQCIKQSQYGVIVSALAFDLWNFGLDPCFDMKLSGKPT